MICVEYFFPKHPAQNSTPEARQLRRVIIPLVVCHVLIACLGIAFVSVATFIAQFFYIAMLYSVYMTLRTWIVWVYLAILAFNVLSGALSVFLYDGAAFVVYLLVLVTYSLMILKMVQDSAPLRNMAASNDGNYLEPGIRHMLNTAREEFGRRPDAAGPDGRRNTEALDRDDEDPLL